MVRAHGLCYTAVLTALCIGGLIVAWNTLAMDPATLFNFDFEEKPPTMRYLFSFGDSFTSTGFDVNSTDYPSLFNPLGNPRFPGKTSSGGPNWVGVMIRDFAPQATMLYNFAHGGATVNGSLVAPQLDRANDLVIQTRQFKDRLGRHPPHARWKKNNSAAIIWMGTNDVALSFSKSFVGLGAGVEPSQSMLYDKIMTSYIKVLDAMVDTGVRRFVLLNVPPFHRNPKFRSGGQALAKGAQKEITAFNSHFKKRIQTWKNKHEHSELAMLDTQKIFNEILDRPSQYNATDATCKAPGGKRCLWTDDFHPGQAIQRVMGEKIWSSLDEMAFWAPPSSSET